MQLHLLLLRGTGPRRSPVRRLTLERQLRAAVRVDHGCPALLVDAWLPPEQPAVEPRQLPGVRRVEDDTYQRNLLGHAPHASGGHRQEAWGGRRGSGLGGLGWIAPSASCRRLPG